MDRDDLIMNLLPLAGIKVRRVLPRYELDNPYWLYADCQSYLIEELIRAVDRWDAGKGANPRTYVNQRLNGAVIDFLRLSSGRDFTRDQVNHTDTIEGDLAKNGDMLRYSNDGLEARVCAKDIIHNILVFLKNVKLSDWRTRRTDLDDFFKLRYIDGLLFSEIAKIKNISDSAVSHILKSILVLIKEEFSEIIHE